MSPVGPVTATFKPAIGLSSCVGCAPGLKLLLAPGRRSLGGALLVDELEVLLALDADVGDDAARASPAATSARLPSRTITAGTSRQRTRVASIAIATARPTPNSLTIGSPLRTKLVKTQTMIAAAEVITRPVLASPSITASWSSSLGSGSAPHLGQQEDLVVHREAEEDREHQQRHEADDRDRVVEADQRGAPAELEDGGRATP